MRFGCFRVGRVVVTGVVVQVLVAILPSAVTAQFVFMDPEWEAEIRPDAWGQWAGPYELDLDADHPTAEIVHMLLAPPPRTARTRPLASC